MALERLRHWLAADISFTLTSSFLETSHCQRVEEGPPFTIWLATGVWSFTGLFILSLAILKCAQHGPGAVFSFFCTIFEVVMVAIVNAPSTMALFSNKCYVEPTWTTAQMMYNVRIIFEL